MEELDELLQEFLIESLELLDTLDESFVILEENPSDALVLGSIFRVMHTIKGTCGFLGFSTLEELAHKAENLLSLLRDGSLDLTTAMTDALLATVDRIRQLLNVIENTQRDEGVDTTDLIARLVALADPTAPAGEAADAASLQRAVAAHPSNQAGDAEAGYGRYDEYDDDDRDEDDDLDDDGGSEPGSVGTGDQERLGDLLVSAGSAGRTAVEIAAAEQQFGDTRPIGEILVSRGEASEQEVVAALEQQGSGRNAADSTIRVDVDLLDDLMNLVGELVLARNEVMQLVGANPDGALAVSAQRLNIITSELQERVMKTRMQPIGTVWGKLPRVVRDLAHQLGKQVRLEMEGKETELDKSLIEAIKDPLTHLVRNTVDHGIETPERRQAAGKPVEGVLRLTAGHEGGQVNIEIRDDGAGIDLDRVRAKAVENGIVTPEVAAAMTDAEVTQLIFMPGFSTAKQVTNVSGRGVGMDVVKTNIEKIGGSVEVRSVTGHGTTFKIKIPLTLAIIPALIVGCSGRRYAIPQINLVELVRVDGDERGRGIEYLHGAPVFRLRERLLPVVDLRGRLGNSQPTSTECDMVVLSAEDQRFGVLVDDIFETQEIVVKPLGQVVADAPLFSGATILGDGRVALIIDVMGLAQETRIMSSRSASGALRDTAAASVATPTETETSESLLLLAVGQGRRVAMAVSDVARLEEFRESQLEMSAYRPVVQYRDEIMPLVDLAEDLGYGRAYRDPEGNGTVNVVVYHHNGRDIGLMIDEVLDIVDEQMGTTATGGTVVVQGRVTELFDPSTLPSLAALDRELQLQEAL